MATENAGSEGVGGGYPPEVRQLRGLGNSNRFHEVGLPEPNRTALTGRSETNLQKLVGFSCGARWVSCGSLVVLGGFLVVLLWF